MTVLQYSVVQQLLLGHRSTARETQHEADRPRASKDCKCRASFAGGNGVLTDQTGLNRH
jgi:hypothetical protein